MSAAPIKDSVGSFHFPPHRIFSLPSGAKVFVVHDPSQELLSLSVVAKAGSTQEHHGGEAGMGAAMLVRGTKKLGPTDFAERIDSLGAAIRGMGHRDTTGVGLTGLATYSDDLFALIADCIHEPLFDADEFERLRFQWLSDQEYSLSDPQYLAGRCFSELMFSGHPYGRSRHGTLDTLKTLTREQCVDFYATVHKSAPWFVVVAGNFPPDRVDELVHRHFDTLNGTSAQLQRIEPAAIDTLRCGFSACEQAQQAVLHVGQLSIGRESGDFPGLQLLNTAFGGYFLSRLNSIIREQKGFSYGVHSSLDAMVHGARLAVSCSVSHENLAETIAIIRSEWTRLAEEKISEDELRHCKRYILGSFARGMETPQQVAQFLGNAEEFGLQPSYYEDFVARIAELSADDLLEVQHRQLHPNQLVIAASGKADLVRPVLEHVGDTREINVL